MLRRRHHPQTQASRKAERRQKAHEAHRPRGHSAGGVPGGAESGGGRVIPAASRDCGSAIYRLRGRFIPVTILFDRSILNPFPFWTLLLAGCDDRTCLRAIQSIEFLSGPWCNGNTAPRDGRRCGFESRRNPRSACGARVLWERKRGYAPDKSNLTQSGSRGILVLSRGAVSDPVLRGLDYSRPLRSLFVKLRTMPRHLA